MRGLNQYGVIVDSFYESFSLEGLKFFWPTLVAEAVVVFVALRRYRQRGTSLPRSAWCIPIFIWSLTTLALVIGAMSRFTVSHGPLPLSPSTFTFLPIWPLIALLSTNAIVVPLVHRDAGFEGLSGRLGSVARFSVVLALVGCVTAFGFVWSWL